MIELRVPRDTVSKLRDSPVLLGLHILNGLRGKGAPVEGVLFPCGVSTGRLEVETDDLATDDWIWRWYPA